MASSAACECGAGEQIVNHVVLHCPTHPEWDSSAMDILMINQLIRHDTSDDGSAFNVFLKKFRV